ncbi:Crp/Fnr family transcriptional regulator [Halomonas sp. MCCC 1A17488]|uniref:Crp/Fnr family transcriptional regulator n=1 Tax=Billgrantia sulfidoxydans TaxID=2733484 RepID=A0ABX7W4G4_9GAMM|nr:MULTISPECIES: Crp/Fnr family transcriptional regulator [Halomonas]MCE8014953.1 Crp/Fnr family transcriptional regulator [Halomonas sp. MCCC 1A17488]MCG3238286.1 Crp/Fnr family transcriptional regulator [Halomonas sp. MCCC 1A17488]QPP47957.1 Crp/Fnr family transcriptional regulator [Halomonas sp. SS10-MC5]QTP55266.1 Crp/Fnr family transcriptional regulator [Halomonas sulfidoxydans]
MYLFHNFKARNDLCSEDKRIFDSYVGPAQEVKKGSHLAREGETLKCLHLIEKGWACRYRMLRDGSEPITSLLLPGDISDNGQGLHARLEFSIKAITPLRFTTIDPAGAERLFERPRILRLFRASGHISHSTALNWIINVSARSAEGRIANLLCECYARSHAAGLTYRGRYFFPLTQTEISDVLGLSSVHVSRSISKIKRKGLIENCDHKQIRIKNWRGLATLGDFRQDDLELSS